MIFPANGSYNILLEAEVSPKGQNSFERRYFRASGITITPGNPAYYQSQTNKWGAELRIYFNDPSVAVMLHALGIHVEDQRSGYKSGAYRFRSSKNSLWWTLVEAHSFRLGLN